MHLEKTLFTLNKSFVEYSEINIQLGHIGFICRNRILFELTVSELAQLLNDLVQLKLLRIIEDFFRNIQQKIFQH